MIMNFHFMQYSSFEHDDLISHKSVVMILSEYDRIL